MSRRRALPPTVREILANRSQALTPSESKIAQLLLADYPVAGLGTASSLAKRAGVSDPTVVRFIHKLGFEHFSTFQARLLGEVEASLISEVEARLGSPAPAPAVRQPAAGGAARGYLVSVARELHKAAEAAVDRPYEHAADLIMRTRGQVVLLGGRFSRHVAAMLAGYLLQFRAGVHLAAPLTLESFDGLADLGPRDTLVVFDYRRYQTDVVEYARQAQQRGVRVVLFSDPWRSPIAEIAEVVIIASAEADSPYDSLAPAVAQMEALVARIIARDQAAVEARIGEIEKLRARNAVTMNSAAPLPLAPSDPRRARGRRP